MINTIPGEPYTILTECEHCGSYEYCRYGNDPLREEVYGEITEGAYWCERCWCGRKEDI